MSMNSARLPAADSPLLGGFSHTVNGESVPGASTFPVVNPSTGMAFAECPDAPAELLDRAVCAASTAQRAWKQLSFERRRGYLHDLAAALRAASTALAPLLTREQGKPLFRSRDEIERAAASLEALSNLELQPEVLRDDENGRTQIHFRPLGVVGAITPWNVPLVLAAPKIAQALYAGNTMVLKPSPYTPLTTLELGRISREVLPPGVLNVIAGSDDLGRWMTEHPGIAKISFTGSVATGKRVMASAAGSLKRLTLELGGNDPAIVLADADPRQIAERIFWAAFYNSGQTCMAIKRLYVHDRVYDALCEELARLARTVKVGDGMEEGVQIGPVQNRMQFQIVRDVLNETRALPGARILAGGNVAADGGYFVEPTVVAGVSEGCRLVDEETFGPVLPVIRFHDVEDAIARANDSRMGLGGSVWTSDLSLGEAIAQRLEVGTAWVNHHSGVDMLIPFGGIKESGLGREFATMGLKGYTEAHVVRVPKLSQRTHAR